MLEIICEADLQKITVKGVRQLVEQEDSMDYSGEKAFFAEIIKKCLLERTEQENENESLSKDKKINTNSAEKDSDDYKMALQLQQDEERSFNRSILRRRAAGINKKYQEGLIIKPSKNTKTLSNNENLKLSKKPMNRVLNKPLLLSSEMSAVFGNQFTELTRPEVIKKLWDYIKEHNLQDPKDKRFILCDEMLMKVFNRPRLNCFKMAKFLTTHLHRKEDLSDASHKKVRADSTENSPNKKKKISKAMVEDSDQETSDTLQNEKFIESKQIHPSLLQVPGVTPDMSYSAMQAAILAYTQSMKLRNTSDNDLIIIKPGSPIAKLMDKNSPGTVHILDLIQRVHTLFETQNEK